jgi:putative FmdB family regulatory protein
MPTYDYKCEQCGHVFEVRHAFDAEPPETCHDDSCDGTLRRVFSPPTIIFKGSGWHVTDYGRGSNGDGVDRSREKAEETVETSSD